MKKLITIFLMTTALSARGQVTISDMNTSLIAVDQLINRALTKVDKILDDQQRNLFLNLGTFTSVIRSEMGTLLNDADRKLTKKQMQIFNDLQAQRLLIEQFFETGIGDIKTISISLKSSIEKIPFVKKYPSPVFYRLPVFVQGIDNKYKIIIDGTFLKNDNNYIEIFGKTFRGYSPTNEKIIFEISILAGNNISLGENKFILHLYYKNKSYKYTNVCLVIPQKVAEVKMHYTYLDKERIFTERYTQRHSLSARNCHVKDQTYKIDKKNLEGEFYIDRESIRVSMINGAQGAHTCRLDNTNGLHSFTGKIFSSCDCQGGLIRGCGTTTCEFSWREFRYRNIQREYQIVKTVYYNTNLKGETISQNLEKKPDDFRKIEVEFFNGQKQSYSSIINSSFLKFIPTVSSNKYDLYVNLNTNYEL